MAEKHESQPSFTRFLNRQMLSKLVVVAVLMFGFGYALVPIYKKICELTGLDQLTPTVGVEKARNTQVDTTRNITVEFDANARGPWRFRPTVSNMTVHPGEMATVIYEVVNTQDREMVAQAIPSYAPMQAEKFFNKVECFCFKQQTLKAKEAKQMPVMFYIDPALPKDVKVITLSYTFFEVGGTAKKD